MPPEMTKAASDRKRKRAKFLPHVGGRKAGITAGLQGFLITCVGGKERQSVREAISMLEMFWEKLQEGGGQDREDKGGKAVDQEASSCSEDSESDGAEEFEEKQTRVRHASGPERERGIDDLLEAELKEIREKTKDRFSGFETGCHGIVFIRMRKSGSAGPTPLQLAEAVVQEAADTKKSCTRFCLRLMPAEATMYASKAEVERGAKAVILQHFPTGPEQKPLKFAIVCESRANTTIDKMELIKAVAGLVPEPHSVDLKNPDKTILVQVVKTACVVGVVKRFKELAKYNLRQLTSEAPEKEPKPEHEPKSEKELE